MASESKHPHEFRRYRQGLTLLYFAIVAAGGLLLILSIVWQLVAPHPRPPPGDLEGAQISAHDPDEEELLACHDDLFELLGRLGAEAGSLLSAPPRGETGEVGTAWNEVSREWLKQHKRLGVRCRFEELALAQRGATFERMAEVHRELPAQLDYYENLLEQFDDVQAGQLAQMREALQRSRESLKRRHRAASSP